MHDIGDKQTCGESLDVIEILIGRIFIFPRQQHNLLESLTFHTQNPGSMLKLLEYIWKKLTIK